MQGFLPRNWAHQSRDKSAQTRFPPNKAVDSLGTREPFIRALKKHCDLGHEQTPLYGTMNLRLVISALRSSEHIEYLCTTCCLHYYSKATPDGFAGAIDNQFTTVKASSKQTDSA